MRLTLYIPGLFGPDARFSREFIPRAPALEVILARASRIEPPTGARHQVLSSLFGLTLPPGADAPVAAVSRFVDTGERNAGWWLRADPVHLRADRAGLVLIPASGLAPHEARSLAAGLEDLLSGIGELEVVHPDRWYLKLQRDPELRTHELDEVSARDIRHALPGGPGAASWHRLLNEIQMRLHGHEINTRREARGEPIVNSLWFWGGGVLPGGLPRKWSRVVGGGSYAEGLARLCGTPFSHGAGGGSISTDVAGDGGVLVVLDNCAAALATQDLQAWNREIGRLETEWFDHCERLLAFRTVRRLEILTERHGFALTPRGLLRFWRRATLSQFCAGAS